MTKELPILCGNDGCKFKKSKENKYCGKHQLCLFADETAALNKKVCYSYIRGCREQLGLDYKFSKCQACLEKDRKKDNEKRAAVKLKNEEFARVERARIQIEGPRILDSIDSEDDD